MDLTHFAFLIFFSLQPVVVTVPTTDHHGQILLPDSHFVQVAQRFSGYGVPMSFNSNALLYKNLYDWLGTPHRRRSKNGIDCSRLVIAVMQDVFGISLTGSSRDMARMVEPLEKDQLLEGDLVFFNTLSRPGIDHVGIYVGNDRFIHSSSSRGVIVSNINSPYFRRTFVSAGRLPHFVTSQIGLGAEN